MTAVDAPTAQQPTAAPAPTQGPAPAGRYIGRHRTDTKNPRGRHLIAASEQVPADWSPLHPADVMRLRPSSRQQPDWFLPAGPTERTAPIDTAAVLAELRDDLTHPDDTRQEQA